MTSSVVVFYSRHDIYQDLCYTLALLSINLIPEPSSILSHEVIERRKEDKSMMQYRLVGVETLIQEAELIYDTM